MCGFCGKEAQLPVSDGKARHRPNFAALRRAWGFEESLAAYTAQAAAKLRLHGLLAAGCNIYAQVFASGGGISPERSEPRKRSLEGCDFLGRTVVFPAPTDATNEMLRAIREEVDVLCGIIPHGVLSLALMVCFGSFHHTTDCDAFVRFSRDAP